jgi:hypothetical protein
MSPHQLLYRAGDRTRTGDVQLGKLAFYQLNYARVGNAKQCSADLDGFKYGRGHSTVGVRAIHI